MKANRWMPEFLLSITLTITGIVGLAAPAVLPADARAVGPGAQKEGSPAAPETQMRIQINYPLELHNELLLASTPNGTGLLDAAAYRSEIESYKQAREMVKEFKAWRIVNDACVEGPDAAAIRGNGERLSADLSPQDRDAVKKMLDALSTAYARWEGKEMLLRQRGLKRFVGILLGRTFDAAAKKTIMTEVDRKLGFHPLDAPLGIYIVVDAADVGAWGWTPSGYYIVIPVQNREVGGVIEAIVHESTHLLDSRQPPGSSSILGRLRTRLSGEDSVAVDTLLHGLVAFNAGQMVKRFVKPDYAPIVEVSPTWRTQLAEYLPALQGGWNDYLDGKIDAEKAVGELAATVKHPAAPK